MAPKYDRKCCKQTSVTCCVTSKTNQVTAGALPRYLAPLRGRVGNEVTQGGK